MYVQENHSYVHLTYHLLILPMLVSVQFYAYYFFSYWTTSWTTQCFLYFDDVNIEP